MTQFNLASPKDKISGHYVVERLSPFPGRYLLTEFQNLITNNGLDLWGVKVQNSPNMILVGSGSNPPTFQDTSLGSFVASTTNSTSTSGTNLADRYAFWRRIFSFNPSQVIGNISEVACGIGQNNLFSRALILDGSGNPTTITLISGETLRVTYEIRLQIPSGDFEGVVTVGGSEGRDYDYIARPIDINGWRLDQARSDWPVDSDRIGAYSGALAIETASSPLGTAYRGISSMAPYVSGSHTKMQYIYFGTTGANGTVTTLILPTNTSGMRYQFQLIPPIVKTNEQTLSFETASHWGRA